MAKTLLAIELKVLNALWTGGPCSIRQLHMALPTDVGCAYSTVQLTVRRLQDKRAVRCAGRTGNARIFAAVISRSDVGAMITDQVIAALGGDARTLIARLAESGDLTLRDLRQAAKSLNWR